MAGNSLTDACDAIVELEVIGFQFLVDGEHLHFEGKYTEAIDGNQMSIPSNYINSRLALIKEYKPGVVAWLQIRTKADILRSLDRLTDQASTRAKAWQNRIECHRKQVEIMWSHFEKLFNVFVQLDAEVSMEAYPIAVSDESPIAEGTERSI